MTGLVQRILELAARDQGYHSSDTPDVETTVSCTLAGKLVTKGKLFKVRLEHRRVLFFTDPVKAQQLDKGFNRFTLKPKDQAPAAQTEVITPPTVQIQYGRRYEPRFVALSELAPLLKR